MPRRRDHLSTGNLKSLLGKNGLAWPDYDHVLPMRAQDRTVRLGLHNLLGMATPLRPADVQAEMITVFELATRLLIEMKGRGQELNEVDFVRWVWAGHRLYLHVGVVSSRSSSLPFCAPGPTTTRETSRSRPSLRCSAVSSFLLFPSGGHFKCSSCFLMT